MTAFEKIILPFVKKRLQQNLATDRRHRSAHNFWTARTIGILFDAEKKDDRSEAALFAKALGKEGKKVRLLGYFHKNKLDAPPPPFDYFLKKQTSILGTPQAENASKFSKEKLDLLLVFNPAGYWAIEHLAAATPAAMKIGTLSILPNNFDFMLEMPQNTSFSDFLRQLDQYLEKITPAHVATNQAADEPIFAKI